ncbi:MAG: 5-(carboxyamino)imidazole ribonucleotide synthase [Methylophilus sp.]
MSSQASIQNQSLHNQTGSVIQPSAMLGMLGGGQLGRFFVIAAHEMGYKVTVLDPDKHSPAGKIADVHLCAAFDDAQALQTMAQTCQAISTEFENVPAETLATLAKSTIVHPSADAVAIAQHRIKEKNFFKEAGLPIGPFVAVTNESDLPEDGDLYPAVLKVARFGYDGKGQTRVANQAEAKAAFQNFKQEVCVLEKMLSLDLEVSVVLARDVHGNIAAFPTAENSHLNGILDVSIAPARCSEVVKANAQELAKQLAAKLHYVGVLGVEFFVVGSQLLINEIAPRPHNSGHYTVDACITNQFEQQVRVITGQALGNPNLHSNAVMVNILGDSWLYSGQQQEPAWDKAFAHGNLKMHLYGKQEPRKGRKMGHFTVIGEDAQSVLNVAKVARSELHIGE